MRAGTAEASARVYCLVPRELAAKLHEPLRRHFRDDASVEVVVERRGRERRSADDRRAVVAERATERRLIHNLTGRRVGEQRAALVEVERPPLPRRLQRHAPALQFVERVEPSSECAEDLDTARLVTTFQAGERDAFATLYLRYFDRVYGYLKLAVRNPHEAEDATQQVFTRALQALPRYERRTQPFRAWLFSIARNVAINELTRQGKLSVVDPFDIARQRDTAEDAEVRPEVLDWISDRELVLFIERLPQAQRHVLALRYLVGLRSDEIALALDTNAANVRRMQHRALSFLRARLAAVGRTPQAPHGRIRMRTWPKPAQVIRRRRFALLS